MTPWIRLVGLLVGAYALLFDLDSVVGRDER